MFTLIISLVSIALVAALALTSIYYGGASWVERQAKANATTAISQATQVLGAAELHLVGQGSWPDTVDDLIASNYLKSSPVLMDTAWVQPLAGVPTFWAKKSVDEETCKAVNLASRGDNGIYRAARPGLVTQCFGTKASYTVVTTRLAPGAPGLDVIFFVEDDEELLYDETGGGWAVPPTVGSPSSGGGGGSGIGGPPSGADMGTSGGGYFGGNVQASFPGRGDLGGSNLGIGSFVGSGKVVETIEFTNTGSGPSNLGGAGGYGDANLIGSTCSGILAVGSSCYLTIQIGPFTGLTGQRPLVGGVWQEFDGKAAHVGISGSVYPGPLPDLPLAVETDDPNDSAGRLMFPDTPVGASSYKWVRTQNIGDPLVFNNPGASAVSPYSIVQTDCAVNLPTGDSCRTRLRFTPPAQAEYINAPYYFTIGANNKVARLELSGRGIAPTNSGITLSTTKVDFGKLPATGEHVDGLTVTNSGSSAINFAKAMEITPASSPFTVKASTCAATLPPGETCTVWVRFAPIDAQEFSGALVIDVQGLGQQEVSLTGQADNPLQSQKITVPRATRGVPYTVSPDFAQAFSLASGVPVANDQLELSLDPALSLPQGMVFDKVTRKLSGTPNANTIEEGNSFKILARYQNRFSGEQEFTLQVGDVVFEAVQYSAGGFHTCAVTPVGGVKCWGWDNFGQLGDDNTLTLQRTPVDVQGLTSGVVSVSAGNFHTCAVTTAGGVKCWGQDSSGQLGNDTALTNSPTPVNVFGLSSGISHVESGGSYSCALTTSGGIKCWGNDQVGQLGNDGSLTNQPTPVNVLGLTSGVRSISTGGATTCAVTTAGGLKCWGWDNYGQLGNDNVLADKATPVDVKGLTEGVSSVSAGNQNACAVTTSGGLKCWGRDNSGQLGNDAALADSTTPVDVAGLTQGVSSVSVSESHVCAVTNAGGLKCWGYDGSGQLGNDVALTNSWAPVDVFGLTSGVVSVSTGVSHTCALSRKDGLLCWGGNGIGQLGIADTSGRTTPIPAKVVY
ncbi:choice-of-anchor D domain-containing protein [Nostoc sp. CHAB 5834]|nr:choice-of-anchor D domain-containing protein [Nostoc sp. CHAB 5834]